jgi:hypothetical protein
MSTSSRVHECFDHRRLSLVLAEQSRLSWVLADTHDLDVPVVVQSRDDAALVQLDVFLRK